MKLDFIDVRRAYFHSPAIRRVFVELPEGDPDHGSMFGERNCSMYGTRDAAQNWANAYTEFMMQSGFRKGKASPCAFWHPTRDIRCGVHGDDFTVLARESDLDWFWEHRFDLLGVSELFRFVWVFSRY